MPTAHEFEALRKELQEAWAHLPDTKDAALKFILEQGTRHGYKNVLLALGGRTPRSIQKGQTVEQFIASAQSEEG